jgi:hypothetical protein
VFISHLLNGLNGLDCMDGVRCITALYLPLFRFQEYTLLQLLNKQRYYRPALEIV